MALLATFTARAVERAYYSKSGSAVSTSGTNVALSASASADNLTLTATVTASPAGPVRLRLKLNGIAPAGYRAGMLVARNSNQTLLSDAGTVTIRTFLGDGGLPLQERTVEASLVNEALLDGSNGPRQFELPSTKDFDQVEIEFGQAGGGLLNTRQKTDIIYAYGIGSEFPKPTTGFLSQFSAAATQYSTSGKDGSGLLCVGSVNNPERAVDSDLTNYATFNSLAGLSLDPSTSCLGALRVNLAGVVPGSGFRAGFVIGNSGLLDLGVLSGLRIHTFRNGVEQQVASATDLLQVNLLADGLAQVSFPASKEFDAVSIERTGAVALLDNLRIYYGFGLDNASFTTSAIATSYPLSTGKYTVRTGGLLCALCSSTVVTPTNAAPYIKLTQALNAVGSEQVQFPLDRPGVAGNRAGLVLGKNTLLDVNALQNITLTTYDDQGKVLETADASSLLSVNLLPDGRQEVSFRTTRNFTRVGMTVKAGVSALNDLGVYSAFADDRGVLQIAPPVVLPVTLAHFEVSRAAGTTAALVAWTTASEQRSASFVVERSTSPQDGFRPVGRVAAAGSSATAHQYSLRDATAPARTLVYYRLRQLDTDGSEHLSPVVVLAADPVVGGFTLYPNPAPAGTVSLGLDGPAATGTVVAIYSPLGQLLRRQVVGGNELAAVSTAGLPAGIYHVVLRDAAGQPLGTQRLVINN